MIRALLISLFLATSAAADTPVPISVANNLKTCFRDASGLRDAARLAQLEDSLATLRSDGRSNVTQVAPGVHHLSWGNNTLTMEFKVRNTQGTAHCLIFGPKLAPGQAALSADKFVEFRMLEGFVVAPAQQGMSRRYVMQNAPYTIELVALQTQQYGEVVGFMFRDIPDGLSTPVLSSGDTNVTYQSVSTAFSNAVNICLRNYFHKETVEASLNAAGYRYGFSSGGSMARATYFTTDNAISLQVGPGSCTIETNYLNPSAAAQITRAALNTNAPGMFQPRIGNRDGCTSFYAGQGLNLPLSLNVTNIASGSPTCIDNGTSRVTFVVAG